MRGAVLVLAMCLAASGAAGRRLVLSLSDLHVDLYYGGAGGLCGGALPSSPPRFGCDPPLALARGAATAANASLGQSYGGACPDLVLMTGGNNKAAEVC